MLCVCVLYGCAHIICVGIYVNEFILCVCVRSSKSLRVGNDLASIVTPARAWI